jgi:hypothetical protein
MLRLGAEAVSVEPDGRGTPDDSRGGRSRYCHAGRTEPQERFCQEVSVSMLFRHTPQHYSHPRSVPAGRRSGECRIVMDQP